MDIIPLNNAVREEFIRRDECEASLILDALYHARVTVNQWYTVDTIIDIITSLSETSPLMIRKGLKSLVYRKRLAPSTGGRRATEIYLPTAIQAAQFLWIVPSPHTDDRTMSFADFKSVSTYKQALHAMFLQRMSEQHNGKFAMGRKKMAKRLGVDPRTLRGWEKKMPVVVRRMIKYVDILPGAAINLPVSKPVERNRWLVVHTQSGLIRYPLVRSIALSAIKSGYKVVKAVQGCNQYSWAGASSYDQIDYTKYASPHGESLFT